MEQFKSCMVWSIRSGYKVASQTLTNRRESHTPLKTTIQLSGTQELIMNFLGRGIKVKPRSLLTMMHFILAKMSFVYLLLFAFSLKS